MLSGAFWGEPLLHTLEEYFREGGPVLLALLVLGFILTLLITERALYLGFVYRPQRRSVDDALAALPHPYVRLSRIGDYELELLRRFPLIKCLIGLCPLLGLLGTVTGMIELFDSLAIQGTGNAQRMASGVARTVYPTLTGMSLALLTLLLIHPLDQYIRQERQHLQSLKLENVNASSAYY